MNNSTNKNEGIDSNPFLGIILFFVIIILVFLIGYNYLTYYFLLVSPLFFWSIIFTMIYFFESRSYIFAIKVFAISFVASSFIFFTELFYLYKFLPFVNSFVSFQSIRSIQGGFIIPFLLVIITLLLPLLIYTAIKFISKKIPGMKFPLRAFIYFFYIPIQINLFIMLWVFAINAR